jgi:hypothetical protein
VMPRGDESEKKSVVRMEATSLTLLNQGCGCALMSRRKEVGSEFGGESEGGTGGASQCRLTLSWRD